MRYACIVGGIFWLASFVTITALYDCLLIQREWNVSLGSADVSWGGVRAIRTTAKETRRIGERFRIRLVPCKRGLS